MPSQTRGRACHSETRFQTRLAIRRYCGPEKSTSGLTPLTQDRYAFAAGNPIDNVESDGHYGGGPCTPYPGNPGFHRSAQCQPAPRPLGNPAGRSVPRAPAEVDVPSQIPS